MKVITSNFLLFFGLIVVIGKNILIYSLLHGSPFFSPFFTPQTSIQKQAKFKILMKTGLCPAKHDIMWADTEFAGSAGNVIRCHRTEREQNLVKWK
jgi:hypothetical protein